MPENNGCKKKIELIDINAVCEQQSLNVISVSFNNALEMYRLTISLKARMSNYDTGKVARPNQYQIDVYPRLMLLLIR